MKYFKKGNFIIVKDASDQEKNSFNLATINRVEIDDLQKKIKFGDGELNFSNFISFTLEDGTIKLKADFPNFSDLKTWALSNFFFVAKSNGGGGGGSVTNVSITSSNGITSSITDNSTTPKITLSLGDITPTSVNSTGSITGSNLSGTNTGDETKSSIEEKLGVSIVNVIDEEGDLSAQVPTVQAFDDAITPVITNLEQQINLKANQSATYTKTEVDNALNSKANQSTTYNKTQVDNALNGKQNFIKVANSDAEMTSALTQNSIVGDYVYRSDLGGVLYRLNALPNTTLSNWSALRETFLPTPIIWAKRQLGYRTYNQDPNSNGQFKEVVNFYYKFPDSWNWNKNDFLNYEPFIEIRLLNSSNKRFKDYQQRIFKKGARMTSPANPYGHPVPLSNRYAVGGSFWGQRTKIKLETGFVFCDKNNNYSFPENQNIGDYDASTNTPNLSSVFSAVGQYLVVQVAGFISAIDANVQVGDMICCDAFDNNSQVFSFLIQKNHKNNINTIKRFDFLPHDFFKESFFFPVQKQVWDDNNAYMNKRSVSNSAAYYGQIIKEQNGNKIPRRSKTLVFGIRLGCVDPKNPNRYIFSDDSNYIRISPVLCKMQNANENYYYGWQISNAF